MNYAAILNFLEKNPVKIIFLPKVNKNRENWQIIFFEIMGENKKLFQHHLEFSHHFEFSCLGQH
jgi:hypothetical protein